VPKTPGKGHFALGKAFAGCSTRQRAADKKSVGKDFFAGCFLSGTQYRKVDFTALDSSALGLPGAMSEAPGKDFFNFFIISLSGVAPPGHPAKSFLYFFLVFSL
jgi:hypothetical protein